jgi:MFS family permease
MLDSLNRNLRYLFIVNFVFGFSVQLITPLFPLYLSDIGATVNQNALVISIGGLSSMVLMLPSGVLLDKIGRRTLLIGSAVVNMLSIFLMTYISSWRIAIPVYALYSCSWAFFFPARMAMITSNSELLKRARVFGIMNTSWPIAGIISPVLSGWLIESTGWGQVFVVGSAVNLLGILSGLAISRNNTVEREQESGGFTELIGGKYVSVFGQFFLYGIVISVANSCVNQIIPLYLDQGFSLSASQIGLFFTVQSFFTLVTQIPSGALADRFGRKRTLLTCLSFIPILMVSWHFIRDWRFLLAVNSLAFGLWSMTWPSILTLLSGSVPDRLVGAAFGLNATGNRLGRTLGPIIGSFFFVSYSMTSPFLVAGLFFTIAICIALTIREPENSK